MRVTVITWNEIALEALMRTSYVPDLLKNSEQLVAFEVKVAPCGGSTLQLYVTSVPCWIVGVKTTSDCASAYNGEPDDKIKPDTSS